MTLHSQQPLLGGPSVLGGLVTEAGARSRRSAEAETRKKYTLAAVSLILSLVSFVVQTETAVHIQRDLGWDKPFLMLYPLPLPPLSLP